MLSKGSVGTRVFRSLNGLFLIIVALICVFPFIHIVALSFSGSAQAQAGLVKFWPVGFTLASYQYVMNRAAFWRSFIITLERVVLGGGVNMLLVIMLAYPLSKEVNQFKARTFYVWFLFVTVLFNGGIIPLYMLISQLKLLNSIWALVLPSAVPVFNVVLMINFFRQIPREMEEAAYIDGASHWKILLKIFLPVSMPSIATIALFTIVGHWNSWFDGLMFMNRLEKLPLQSYLQTVIINTDMSSKNPDDWKILSFISDRTLKSAQLVLATIPILMVYPFLQRYFVTGIVLGSVKG